MPRADMLPEWHQEPVDLDPVLLRQLVLERSHRSFWRRARDISPPVGHSVHVDIDTDALGPARDAHGQVRAFRTDAAKRGQHVEVARQLASELAHRSPSDLTNLRGLALVKAALLDERVDLPNGELGYLRRRRRALQQPNRDRQTDLIARANRDDARDELLKHRFEPTLRQLEHRRVRMLGHGDANTTQHRVNVESTFRLK